MSGTSRTLCQSELSVYIVLMYKICLNIYCIQYTAHTIHIAIHNCPFRVAQQPYRGLCRLTVEAFISQHTTLGGAPLDEESFRHKHFYLTTHNIHKRHPCPRWDSNLLFQKTSGGRPPPQNAWPPRSLHAHARTHTHTQPTHT